MNAVSSSAIRNRRLHKSRVPNECARSCGRHPSRHRCSKSNQLLRTNGFLSRAVRSSCAMPHHSSLVLHLDSFFPTQQASHNEARASSQLPSFQILTCNPPPRNFPAMMISCALSSPARGVRGPLGPKLPSAPRSAGHCSSIMDAVFILV